MSQRASRGERIHELFTAASALEPEARAAYLREHCADDPALRDEVASLLAYEPGPADGRPLATGGLAIQVLQLPTGARVGPFTIERLIGAGASSDVYLATQDQPKRSVALKVLRSAAGEDSRERFEREGAALARLHHPNVAQVYQVGIGDDGRPWIAMELVLGKPITDHAEHVQLGLVERLRMFMTLCEALEHIHDSGIVHRDLKPDNVTVSVEGTLAMPKVLDFGIARAAPDAHEALSLDVTRDGSLMGTLEYASPEQIVDSRRADRRSDVYSAGVMLYELLTGERPFVIRANGLVTFVERVLHEDPEPPSVRLASSPGGLEARAAALGASRGEFARILQDDLDWIVLKALRRTVADRYASAAALRADLQRHLEGLPISARPPGRAYRVRKFVTRHRIGVLATAVVVVALVAGFVATTVQYQLARRRLDALERLSTDLVSSLNQIQDIPGAMSAKERIVTSAASTLEQLGRGRLGLEAKRRLADAYERVGQLRGDAYSASVGDVAAGGADLRRALELRQEVLRERNDVEAATDLIHTAFLLALVIQAGAPLPPDPDSLLVAVTALGRPLAEREPYRVRLVRELAYAEDLRAEFEFGDGAWAHGLGLIRAAYLRRLRLAERYPQDDEIQRDVGQSLARLAYAALDPDSSRRMARESLAIAERYGQRHPYSYRANLDVTFALRNAAYGLQRCDSLAAAMALYRRCVELRRVMALSDTMDVRSYQQYANAMEWLSTGWLAVGRADSALATARRAVDIRREIAARVDPGGMRFDPYLMSQRAMARAEAFAGHWAEAEAAFDGVCAVDWPMPAVDRLKRWRDQMERAHTYRRHGGSALADTLFLAAIPTLELVEQRVRAAQADSLAYADLALARLHMGQVLRGHEESAAQVREALALPGLLDDSRDVRALLENEAACQAAVANDIAGAERGFAAALAHARRASTRQAITANRAVLMWLKTRPAGRAAAARVAAYDAEADPYSRLAVSAFRIIPVWGDLPTAPPARLVRGQASALGQMAADPGKPKPRVVGDRPRGDAE